MRWGEGSGLRTQRNEMPKGMLMEEKRVMGPRRWERALSLDSCLVGRLVSAWPECWPEAWCQSESFPKQKIERSEG